MPAPIAWTARLRAGEVVSRVVAEGLGGQDAGAARDTGGRQRDHLSRGCIRTTAESYAKREAVAGAQQNARSRCSPEGNWRRERRPRQHHGVRRQVPWTARSTRT